MSTVFKIKNWILKIKIAPTRACPKRAICINDFGSGKEQTWATVSKMDWATKIQNIREQVDQSSGQRNKAPERLLKPEAG
jgi:hypothetical protein